MGSWEETVEGMGYIARFCTIFWKQRIWVSDICMDTTLRAEQVAVAKAR